MAGDFDSKVKKTKYSLDLVFGIEKNFWVTANQFSSVRLYLKVVDFLKQLNDTSFLY